MLTINTLLKKLFTLPVVEELTGPDVEVYVHPEGAEQAAEVVSVVMPLAEVAAATVVVVE